jgi:hypothetical protein
MGCVFSGGTGQLEWFHADVKLSLLNADDPTRSWSGMARTASVRGTELQLIHFVRSVP